MTAKLSRRRFLTLAAAASPLAGMAAASSATRRTRPGVGIALGGGGARGLAHVEMLQVLDDLGIEPCAIAGTSIGAVIGALYATGKSAAQIRSIVTDALTTQHSYARLVRKEILEWAHLVDPAMTSQALLGSSDFIAFIHEQVGVAKFEELRIPLLAVAADIRRREQVILRTGDLITALQASVALPGLFDPVVIGDSLLVDGGIVNPVPFDLLFGRCDFVIAVDVAGRRTYASPNELSFFDVLSESFQTMEHAILEARMSDRRPDIYIRPDLVNIRLLDFAKAEDIYAQARPAAAVLKEKLRRTLAPHG